MVLTGLVCAHARPVNIIKIKKMVVLTYIILLILVIVSIPILIYFSLKRICKLLDKKNIQLSTDITIMLFIILTSLVLFAIYVFLKQSMI